MPPLMTQELIKDMKEKIKNYKIFSKKMGQHTEIGKTFQWRRYEVEHWLSKIQKLSK